MGKKDFENETVDHYDACQLFDTTKNAENTKKLNRYHQFGRLGHYNGSPVMLGGASSSTNSGENIVEKLQTIDPALNTGWTVETSLEMEM